MKSMMSRTPFSRSPRINQESTGPSHGHSHSVPALESSETEGTSPPPGLSGPRRAQTTSVELRGMQRLEARRGMEEHHFLTTRARAKRYNPPVDLRMLDYVSTYDNNLMCPICRCPFVDPVILTECDHCFCRDCIRQTWNMNSAYTPLGPRGDCPSCRTPAKLSPRSATSKILVNLTDELIVRCPKADEGCKVEVKRAEVQDHINIYCGYALAECEAEHCELPLRRKDASQGCLHYGVSCMSCHKELQQWNLHSHWSSECPDRKVHCDLCRSAVFYRNMEEHNKTECPAISTPCPGAAFGCTHRSKNAEAQFHAKTCPLAKLAPILTKQQERLEEQEVAQKQMVRKLEVLEDGFSIIQRILSPPTRDRAGGDRTSVDSSRYPALSNRGSYFSAAATQSDGMASPTTVDFPASATLTNEPQPSLLMPQMQAPYGPTPGLPGPRPNDLPEAYSADFDLQAPASFPSPTADGPYTSPLHHLLSMHENLRDEMARMSSALSELDGRHSMQILNENLRTREEISYLGAQVGGLQRQVHWLTSSQLQRQQVGRSPTPGPAASASASITDGTASAGVEAAVSAVSTAATALRGAARMVNVSGRDTNGMRRGPSEEGRTKL